MRRTLFLTAGLLTLAGPALADHDPSVITSDYHWSQGRFEFGPRLNYLSLTDVDSGQTLPMGGVGGYLRYRFGRRLGAEVSLDLLVSDELGDETPGEVMRVTAPFTVSGMFYLFPRSRMQLYLLAGIGAAGHSVSYEALGETLNFSTPVGQLGVGAQYRTDDLRFDLSFRSLTMSRDAEELEFSKMAAGGADLHPVRYRPLGGDRTVTGGMVTLGVHWGI